MYYNENSELKRIFSVRPKFLDPIDQVGVSTYVRLIKDNALIWKEKRINKLTKPVIIIWKMFLCQNFCLLGLQCLISLEDYDGGAGGGDVGTLVVVSVTR